MKRIEVDVAIIGAGTAGMRAYRAARAHTERLVLIESGPGGTTCARAGCMPSKLLIAAADHAHAARQADAFGVRVAGLAVDGAAVMARVRRERDRFVGFVLDTVDGWPAAHRLRGRARFIGPGRLALDDGTQIDAGRVVIATGARPSVPEAWRAALGERLVTSEEVFDWPELPGAVAVVGTGVIGLELAQALHRLGVRVRLFGRSQRIGPLTDPALQARVRAWADKALPCSSGIGDPEVAREGDGVVVRWHEAGEDRAERFDYLLAAAGRHPDLADLDLAAAGLPVDDRGVPPFDPATGQVGDSPVFIAGDASADRPLLHEADDAGRIAGDNAGRYPNLRPGLRRTPLNVVFTDPQMAIAGASHARLSAAGSDFAVGEVDFANQGRARVMLRNQGLLRVYGRRGDGRLLGAELFGPDAEHLAHLLAWAVQRGDSVAQLLDQPFYHPVLEEGLRTALQALARALQGGR